MVITELNTSTSSDNLPNIKETSANEKKLSKIGYHRVTIVDNWDELKKLWGSSPAATSISSGITSTKLEE